MIKNIAVCSIVFFVVTCMVAVAAYSGSSIDLNRPGVLEKLQHQNPEHYRIIQEILSGLYRQRDSGVPHWIQTKFNAQDVTYLPVLLTSLPPQRRLSFALDNTHYKALLTLTDIGPVIITGD
jgi:hypothetical protein